MANSRSDSTSRWEWIQSCQTFCVVVLSCCLLPLPSESTPIQAGYVWNGDPGFANITGPTAAKRVSTTFLASSPNEQYALALTIETSETSTPTCYLEVFSYFSSTSEIAPPPGSLESHLSFPWTQPCPRKSVPNGNCTFAFTKDGDIQLLNTVAGAGHSSLVWNSNTSGLGATTLELRDYDIVNYYSEYSEYDGNLVLKNSSGDIVWENGQNDTNYGCGDPSWGLLTSHAAAAKGASVTNLICLALISFAGAALMLWDSGSNARPGRRDQMLIVACCCLLLLPSFSESKPIQAGFTTNLWQNFTVDGGTGLIDMSNALVESATNRTALVFHVAATGGWGATCYLSVGADRQSTDIVLNASAPSTTDVNTVEYVPWSAPCPRKLLPSAIVNCTFTFTVSGDIQLHSFVNVDGAGTPSELLWSSNTAGLGVTSLDMLDSDPTGSGSMVLYNKRSEVVWRNILNATDHNFQCSTPTSEGAALQRMSIIASSSLALLVLSTSFLL